MSTTLLVAARNLCGPFGAVNAGETFRVSDAQAAALIAAGIAHEPDAPELAPAPKKGK